MGHRSQWAPPSPQIPRVDHPAAIIPAAIVITLIVLTSIVFILIVLTLTLPCSSFTFKWGRASYECASLRLATHE